MASLVVFEKIGGDGVFASSVRYGGDGDVGGVKGVRIATLLS